MFAREHRRLPLQTLGKLVEPNISATVVRTILDEQGYHRRKARKVPKLNAVHRAKRFAWAQRFQAWPDCHSRWRHVIWSDESYITLGDTPGAVWVTRWPQEEYDDDCVVPVDEQSNTRIMVWGCIMKGGVKGPLVVLDYPGGKGGGFNSQKYREQVLEGLFLNFYKRMSEVQASILCFEGCVLITFHTGTRCRAAFPAGWRINAHIRCHLEMAFKP